jgi:hypothetical protein
LSRIVDYELVDFGGIGHSKLKSTIISVFVEGLWIAIKTSFCTPSVVSWNMVHRDGLLTNMYLRYM